MAVCVDHAAFLSRRAVGLGNGARLHERGRRGLGERDVDEEGREGLGGACVSEGGGKGPGRACVDEGESGGSVGTRRICTRSIRW